MLFILTAIILWSSLGIFIRMSPLPVHILIFYSNLLSSVLLSFIVMQRIFRQKFPAGRDLVKLTMIGPVSLVNTFLFFYAYKKTSIANAILAHYTSPLFVAVMAPFFLHERLTLRIIFSVAAATAGMWIMLDMSVVGFASSQFSRDSNAVGIAAGIFSGLSYAVLIIALRAVTASMNVVVVAFVQNIMIILLLVPFVDFRTDISGSIILILVMGLVHSTLAPLLYFRGIKDVTANRAAIIGYLEPVCAIVLAYIFLGESITIKSVLGGMIILFSGWLTMVRNKIEHYKN